MKKRSKIAIKPIGNSPVKAQTIQEAGVEETLDLLDFLVAIREVLDSLLGKKLNVFDLFVKLTPVIGKAQESIKDSKLIISVELVDASNEELMLIEAKLVELVKDNDILDVAAGLVRSLRGVLRLAKR